MRPESTLPCGESRETGAGRWKPTSETRIHPPPTAPRTRESPPQLTTPATHPDRRKVLRASTVAITRSKWKRSRISFSSG